jgi:hypothetical protein
MREAPDPREQEDCPGGEVCVWSCDQHQDRPMTPDDLRDVLAEVIQPAFDEWLFRMHGVVSSCGHETEAEGIADALAPTVERLITVARAEGRALGRFETTTGHKPEPRDPNYQAGYSRGCGEQAAADRERIEALLHPERGMGVSVYGDGRRFFDEADIRAALDSEGGA